MKVIPTFVNDKLISLKYNVKKGTGSNCSMGL
jgi:hypothetical protein